MSMNNMNTNGHKVDTFNTFISSFFFQTFRRCQFSLEVEYGGACNKCSYSLYCACAL